MSGVAWRSWMSWRSSLETRVVPGLQRSWPFVSSTKEMSAPRADVSRPTPQAISEVRWSPDRDTVVVGCEDSKVYFYSTGDSYNLVATATKHKHTVREGGIIDRPCKAFVGSTLAGGRNVHASHTSCIVRGRRPLGRANLELLSNGGFTFFRIQAPGVVNRIFFLVWNFSSTRASLCCSKQKVDPRSHPIDII